MIIMSSLFEIGTRSLTASQYALTITSKNIANANTPFYSRREMEFSEAFGALFGNGVNVSDVRRIFDDMTNKNLQKTTSEYGRASQYTQNIKNLESILDGDKNGIANAMDESSKALNNMNSNPSSLQPRELYFYQINNMAARMNSLDSQLNAEQRNINSALSADVELVNQALQQLAKLNSEISTVSEVDRLDLLDAREALIHTVSTYIGVETSTDESGVLAVNLSNGTSLLSGDKASSLTTNPAAGNPLHLDIAVEQNNTKITITGLITSGEMAGYLSYQKNGLDDSKNALGQLALVYAQKMNNQNKLGIDLQGNLGGNIFTDINSPNATKNRVITYSSNQGVGDLSVVVNDASQLTVSDYQLKFDSPTHYQLMRMSDNQLVGAGDSSALPLSINADGFSINIASGTFVSGDAFTIAPTKNGAAELGLAMKDASKLALGFPVAAESAIRNHGSGKINLTAMRDTTKSAFSIPKQLNPPIRVEFLSSTTYQLINANNNTVMETNIAYDPTNGRDLFPTPAGYDPGFSIYLSGDNQAGDTFTINYNTDGAGDNRNGLMFADLNQYGTLNNGTLNFSQAYTSISSSIASKANTANVMLESSDLVRKQAEFRRDQISGVSLQEETINLTRFQQAYQASAQIIDAGQTIFDTLMALTRR